MQRWRVKPRRVGQWILALLLAGAIVVRVAPATASVELRVSRLESEIWQLQSQLRQLEAELRRVDRAPMRPVTPTPAVPRSPERSPLARDPMFDRLATLVVEQKRRLDRLEARIVQLETQSRPESRPNDAP